MVTPSSRAPRPLLVVVSTSLALLAACGDDGGKKSLVPGGLDTGVAQDALGGQDGFKAPDEGRVDTAPAPDVPCVPSVTCAGAGAECGAIDDGCGGELSCGVCEAPDVCTAARRCVCVSTSCQAQDVACGQAPDGCGNMLWCGDCGGGEACVDGACVVETPCEADSTEACTCLGGVAGTRTCASDGSGWLPCACDPPTGRWYKGNLHTHSAPTSFDVSDGHTHDDVAEWFRLHGWDWFAFTEHDAFVDRSGMSDEQFLVLNGIELTSGSGDYYGVHVGAIDVQELVDTPSDLHGKLDQTWLHGGFPILNHPTWSMELRDAWNGDPTTAVADLLTTDLEHMEIWNTHTELDVSDPAGDEAIWDRLLTAGMTVYGVADDDNHGFLDIGGAWNMVWAEALTRDAVVGALKAGHFYASAGPTIHRIAVSDAYLEVDSDGELVEVVGPDLEVLATAVEGQIAYDFAAHPWVRVRVTAGGRKAWTQAFDASTTLALGTAPVLETDPQGPTIIAVEDTTAASTSTSYPGADLNRIVAILPSGLVVTPSAVFEPLTSILDPGSNQATDPAQVLSDDLSCGPDWGGFVSLGGAGGKLAVVFDDPLPVGARVRVEEVDPSLCSNASATPETWRADACHDQATCTLLGDCTLGGPCEFKVTAAHLAN